MVKRVAKKDQGVNIVKHDNGALQDLESEEGKETDHEHGSETGDSEDDEATIVQQPPLPNKESDSSDDERFPSFASLLKNASEDDVAEPVSSKKLPTTRDMICDALENLGEKKGSAPVTIKNYIMGKYPELNASRFKAQFKRAFLKGIDDGLLERTSATTDAAGLTGRVKLAPKKPKGKKTAQTSKASEKQDEESAASGEGQQSSKPAKKTRKAVPKEEPEKRQQKEAAATKSKPKAEPNKEESAPKKRGRKPKAESGETSEKATKPKKATKAKLAGEKDVEKEAVMKGTKLKPAAEKTNGKKVQAAATKPKAAQAKPVEEQPKRTTKASKGRV